MRIPGINFDIEEEDEDVIFRKGKSGNTLAISKSTGEILNRNEDLKQAQLGKSRTQGMNLNNSTVGVKYKQTLDVHGYKVKHTHYNDDGQEYEIYDPDGNYVGTVYSTQDLYEEIISDKKLKNRDT